MIKDIARIVEFLIKYPKSFYYLNLWGRKEINKRSLTIHADKKGTDKGFRTHLYTRIYDDLLTSRRYNIENFLEIGLLCHIDQQKIGGSRFTKVPSLDMWADFFKFANVYGFDIQDFSDACGNWTQIFQGDQSKREDLKKVVNESQKFDIIIDDALHASRHQQISFSYLFQYLNKGGLFIIEDLNYQPPFEQGQEEIKTINCLEVLAKYGEWISPHAFKDEKKWIETYVKSVTFYDSMANGINGVNALAVVEKTSEL